MEEKIGMDNRYWVQLTEFKFTTNYLEHRYRRYLNWNRGYEFFTTLVSSASVAGWWIWNDYPWIWGGLVMISQFTNILYKHLPYNNRMKAFASIQFKLSYLYLDMEKRWYYVDSGKYSDDEINDILYKYKLEWNKMNLELFGMDSLPLNKKDEDKAQDETIKYFENNFESR